jgi:hypothetical protein
MLEVEEADTRNSAEEGHIPAVEVERRLLEEALEGDIVLEAGVVVEDIQRPVEADTGPGALEAGSRLGCTVAAAEVHNRRVGQEGLEEGPEEGDIVHTAAGQGVGLHRAAAAEDIPAELQEAARRRLPGVVPVEDIPVEDPDNTTCRLPALKNRTTARKRRLSQHNSDKGFNGHVLAFRLASISQVGQL